MNRVVLKHVSKCYSDQLVVLTDVDYTFEMGKFYGITGQSGAGKTTLLQIMGTLDEPSGGQVLVNGQNVSHLKSRDKARLRNEQIGFVFQSYFLNAGFNALENVMMPMLLTKASFAACEKRAEDLLEQLGLAERFRHFPAQLSGGEQQRVAVARALVNHPAIVLADEPTGNLDDKNEGKLIEIFSALATQGILVVMVTHNQTVLSQMDQILHLEKGGLLEKGGASYA